MDEISVLDASALIALFDGEDGAEVVAELRRGSFISTVNLMEVSQAAMARSIPTGSRRRELEDLGIAVVPFTAAQAESGATMLEATRGSGLSLADRACLALALELGATAVTGDRAWAEIDVGVEVKLIR